ncbi:MAG: hypothetical protein JSU73_11355 [candidate division WOR-3 bacterium]|nr:MAG: hypothetical protein JSU73_11355 [candidate division WOR-3 bacterium]
MHKTETDELVHRSGSVPSGRAWCEIVQDWEPAFFGDNNRAVKKIQRQTYPELAHELFNAARQRYLSACGLVGVDTRLAELSRKAERYRLPFLTRAYRMMAKFYRYAFAGDQQMVLPFEDRPAQDSMRGAWERYFRDEAERLVETDSIATGILRAVVYHPTPIGDAAEAHVVDLLSHRYGKFHLQRRLELLRQTFSSDELDGWRFAEDVDWDQIALDPRVRPNPPD